MSAQASAVATTPRATTSSTTSRFRLLGALGMAGSPFFFASIAIDGFTQDDASRLAALVGLAFALGWLAIVVGLRALGVAGQRRGARVLLSIMPVTVALACAFQVFEAAAPGSDNLLYVITDIAWPFSMLLLLITGIAAIRAKVLEGWMRFTPLAAALWLPVSILAMGIFGTTAGLVVGAVHVSMAWFVMGYVVWRGGRIAV